MNQKPMPSIATAGLIIAGIAFCISYFVICSGLPPFTLSQDYPFRASLYDAWSLRYLGLWIPATVLVALALLKLTRIRVIANGMLRLSKSIPAWVYWLIIPLCFTIASASTSVMLLGGEPRILDAYNYYFQARNFSLGQFFARAPAVPECFAFPFVILDNGRWYGSVYPGYPIVLSLGMILNIPWLVNPILGGLGVSLLFFTGRRLFSEQTARLAVCLLSVSPFYRMMASIQMAHITAMIASLAAVWTMWEWHTRGKKSAITWPLSAGAAIGYGYITRPQAMLVTLSPFIMVGLWDLLRHRIRIRHLLVFLCILVIFYAILGVYNTNVTGDPDLNPRYHVDPGRRLGFGDDIGEPLPGGDRRGHHLTDGIHNSIVLLSLLNSDLLGTGAWRVFGLVTLGLASWMFIGRRSVVSGLLFAGFLLNLLLYVFYFTPSPNFGPRYLTESLPAVIFLLAETVVFWGAADADRGGKARFLMTWGVCLLVSQWFVYLPFYNAHYGLLPPYTPAEVKTTLESRVSPGQNAIFILAGDLYKMNVFNWNCPNLDGNIFVSGSGTCSIEALRDAFPDKKVFRVTASSGQEELMVQEIPKTPEIEHERESQ